MRTLDQILEEMAKLCDTQIDKDVNLNEFNALLDVLTNEAEGIILTSINKKGINKSIDRAITNYYLKNLDLKNF